MQQMCDRVGIIHKGKVITVKTVDELVNMSQTEGRVVLVAKTDNNQQAAALLEKAGIIVSLMADGVHIETQHEAVPAIVTTLTTNGIGIYALDSRETQTLEDVFMKLTGEDK
jgi:ABC-2 type transport system ATP-binding protein